MDSLSIVSNNLLSPPVIAFAAGVVAVLSRSDLKFPEQVYQALTIYLLLAIGFKGGTAIASTSFSALALPLIGTLVIGAVIPVAVFFATKAFLNLSVANAAALAAHYGSVSAVTFMACMAFLDQQSMQYESFMPAVMAAMEIPAIFVAMLLAKRFSPESRVSLASSIHEVVTGKSLLLLVCGLMIGAFAGAESYALVKPFLVTPFYGVLIIFLLEMGLVAGERLKDARKAGYRLIVFALVAPIVQGIAGLSLAYVIGLSQGGAILFAVLTASASYIAAPAAVRASLPEANPGYYVTTSLGITFPFNLVIGIPLLYTLSQFFYQ
ncbi:MAG: sodium-dependent bicarbonate transport family permease [Verrucomicrobiota bacterium]